jgi:hypothetical protein
MPVLVPAPGTAMEMEFSPSSAAAGGDGRPAASQLSRRVAAAATAATLSPAAGSGGSSGAGAGGESHLRALLAERQRAHQQTLDRINAKIHAAFWVVAAALTLRYTRLVEVTMHDDRVQP